AAGNYLTGTALTMTGGSVTSGGTAVFGLGGNLTYNSGVQATITTKVDLLGGNRTFTINDGTALNDLVLSGQVTGLGGSAITKAGAGALLLNNSTNNYPGLSETQLLTFGGTVTGGTFALSFNGATTAPIAWDATPANLVANIQAALNALPTIGNNNTLVASLSSTIIVVSFQNALAGADQTQLVGANNSPAGPTPPRAPSPLPGRG